MKTRIAMTALALSIFSSLALAESPTDAPLLPDNEHSAVVQQNGNEGRAHKGFYNKDKKDGCSVEKAGQTDSKAIHPTAPPSSEAASQIGASSNI